MHDRPRVLVAMHWLAVLFLLVAAAVIPGRTQVDGRSGCSECHSPREGRTRKGPSLFGIVGRHAGSAPGYRYPDALERADRAWTPERLRWYLSQPARQANPGTRMTYDGLDDAEQRDDLISFPGTVR